MRRRDFLKILGQSAAGVTIPAVAGALCPPANLRVDSGGTVVAPAVGCAGSSAPSAATLRAAGYILVDDYSNVYPNNASRDSAAGINQAILDGYSQHKPVWFSANTTYYVASHIYGYMWRPWSASKGMASSGSRNRHIWQGGNSGARPKIKLMPSASGYDNPSAPKPVVILRLMEAINDRGTATVYTGHPFSNPDGYGDDATTLFGCRIRNLEIDTSAKAGAVGLYFHAAQDSCAIDIKVVATGSLCGIWGLPGRSHGGMNIEVVGGQYGLRTKNAPDTMRNINNQTNGGAGIMVAGLKCYDQTVLSVDVGDSVPLAVCGFHFRKNSGPVINTDSGSTAANVPTLVDGMVELASGIAFLNSNNKNFYLRNVYVSGTNDLIKTGALPTVTGTGSWKLIREYVGHDTRESSGNSVFKTHAIINGVFQSQTAQMIVDVQNDSSPPPATLFSQHILANIPSIDNGTYVDVNDHGAVPNLTALGIDNADKITQSLGFTDSRAAIQSAIDAASAAGHGRVLLRRGVYFIGGTLILRANTKLFGVGTERTIMMPHDSWRPTTGSPAILQTVNDANATTTATWFSICSRRDGSGGTTTQPYLYDRFTHLHWRAGKFSNICAVQTETAWKAAGIPSYDRVHFLFTENGGGRVWFFENDGRGETGFDSGGHGGLRSVKISGTTQPLWIYGCSIEASKNSYGWIIRTNVEIINASNVRIFSQKREGDGASTIIENSTNIGIFASGAMSGAPPPLTMDGYMQILGSSNNVLIANVIVRGADAFGNGNGGEVLREALTGQPVRTVAWPEGISIYKRGNLNDAVMRIY